MERESADKEQPSRKKAGSWIYRGLLIAIVAGSVAAYFCWWSNFRSFRPEFSTAEPIVIRDAAKATTMLLWKETVLVSPFDGAVHFPLGPETVRVSKGDIVAEILSGSRKTVIKAPESGYFLPALDGLEGKWSFSDAWPGDWELPTAGSVDCRVEGQRVARG